MSLYSWQTLRWIFFHYFFHHCHHWCHHLNCPITSLGMTTIADKVGIATHYSTAIVTIVLPSSSSSPISSSSSSPISSLSSLLPSSHTHNSIPHSDYNSDSGNCSLFSLQRFSHSLQGRFRRSLSVGGPSPLVWIRC